MALDTQHRGVLVGFISQSRLTTVISFYCLKLNYVTNHGIILVLAVVSGMLLHNFSEYLNIFVGRRAATNDPRC